MAERRSIAEALATLPPDKLGFIHGNAASPKPPRSSNAAIDVVAATEKPQEEEPLNRRPTSRRTRARPTARVEVPESWKVPITTKLQYGTVQALRRAYLEQKLNHATPDTQQEIVEEAVQDWLRQNGYLDERPKAL
jgi:hypothetical protein